MKEPEWIEQMVAPRVTIEGELTAFFAMSPEEIERLRLGSDVRALLGTFACVHVHPDQAEDLRSVFDELGIGDVEIVLDDTVEL